MPRVTAPSHLITLLGFSRGRTHEKAAAERQRLLVYSSPWDRLDLA